MITTCRRCKAPYWRYRRDFPAPGYCSLACYEERGTKHREPPPPLPQTILFRIRAHNREIHGIDSALLGWNCEACDRLEGEYAESLEYHFARATRELAAAGATIQ